MRNEDKDTISGFDLLANHNGVFYYDTLTRVCGNIAAEEDTTAPDANELSNPAIDVISVPKVNGCHCVIIKSVTSPNKYWLLHINPAEIGRNPFAMYNHTTGYDKLFAGSANVLANETVDIITFGDMNTDLFLNHCKRNNVSIRNFKEIPFEKYFEIQGMTFGSIPKSIFIYFMPMQDNIVVVGHVLHPRLQEKLGCTNPRLTTHIATNVFAEARPLTFYFMGNYTEDAGEYFVQFKDKLGKLTLTLADTTADNTLKVSFSAEHKPMLREAEIREAELMNLDKKTENAGPAR